MKRFNSNEAGANEPVRIEHVFAEKPNGGIVADPGFDAPATTPVYADGDKFRVIKCFRLVAPVSSAEDMMDILPGSGVEGGDVLAYKGKTIEVESVSHISDCDTLNISAPGVDIPAGAVLYQAISKADSKPFGTPVFVTGNDLVGGAGDQPVRLINGANLRKETANISAELADLIPTINLV